MKSKQIKIPIYFGDLHIVKSNNIEKVNKKYKMEMGNEYDAVTLKALNKNGSAMYLVVFRGKKICGSVIAHETTHLVNAIFEHCGIRLDITNDEPQAYLHGYLFKQIDKFVNKKKKKQTK